MAFTVRDIGELLVGEIGYCHETNAYYMGTEDCAVQIRIDEVKLKILEFDINGKLAQSSYDALINS